MLSGSFTRCSLSRSGLTREVENCHPGTSWWVGSQRGSALPPHPSVILQTPLEFFTSQPKKEPGHESLPPASTQAASDQWVPWKQPASQFPGLWTVKTPNQSISQLLQAPAVLAIEPRSWRDCWSPLPSFRYASVASIKHMWVQVRATPICLQGLGPEEARRGQQDGIAPDQWIFETQTHGPGPTPCVLITTHVPIKESVKHKEHKEQSKARTFLGIK